MSHIQHIHPSVRRLLLRRTHERKIDRKILSVAHRGLSFSPSLKSVNKSTTSVRNERRILKLRKKLPQKKKLNSGSTRKRGPSLSSPLQSSPHYSVRPTAQHIPQPTTSRRPSFPLIQPEAQKTIRSSVKHTRVSVTMTARANISLVCVECGSAWKLFDEEKNTAVSKGIYSSGLRAACNL